MILVISMRFLADCSKESNCWISLRYWMICSFSLSFCSSVISTFYLFSFSLLCSNEFLINLSRSLSYFDFVSSDIEMLFTEETLLKRSSSSGWAVIYLCRFKFIAYLDLRFVIYRFLVMSVSIWMIGGGFASIFLCSYDCFNFYLSSSIFWPLFTL